MNPGRMDQRVTFQSVTRATDNMGGAVETWANVPSIPTVWANVRPLPRSSETVGADRVEARGRYLVTIRHRSDIDESTRMVWKSEVYNIRRIERTGGRTLYLTFEAERGAAT